MAAAKARTVTLPEPKPTEETVRLSFNDFTFLVVPTTVFKELSDAAAKRNMTAAQLLSTAITEYLKKTE